MVGGALVVMLMMMMMGCLGGCALTVMVMVDVDG